VHLAHRLLGGPTLVGCPDVLQDRAFRLAGQNFFLPPGVPAERVQILRDAMRKTLNDPEFAKEYQKISAETPTPLMPEVLEKVVRELPRDAAVVEIFNKLAGADPLPGR